MKARKTRMGLELVALLAMTGCSSAEQGSEAPRRAAQALQNLPDFVVTSVTAPASVQQGQSFTTQVTVCNQGTQSASTSLEVYLSADASIHANTSSGPSEDALVGSASTPTLNPNQCATLSVSGSAYPPSPSGGSAPDSAWYVGAVVDPRNSQPELREDNNATAGNRMGVGSLPDFVITSVTAPASVQQGQTFTAQVTVCNQGTQSASTSFEVYLSADTSIHANTSSAPSEDSRVGTGYTSSLAPNQCATVAVSSSAYPPPPSGGTATDSAWYVGAVVDPRNSQPELREDNNATAGNRMGVGSLPDFVITSVTAPASVQQGQSLTTQVTVCNQGTQSASTGLEVYLSADASIHANTSSAPSEDSLVGSASTPTLNPNQCTTLSISGSAYPPSPSGGSAPDSAWYVGAVVDPRNSQPELREDNNATAGNRVGVGYLPDFVITSVTAPVSVQQGQSFTTQVTVCNQGTQSASTGLEVYLSADASIHANTSSGPSEDALVGSVSTPTLNPNQCITLSISGSAYPPPSSAPVGPATDSAWYVGAVVDPRNGQPELREDNNATAGNRMGVGSLPDFVITSVTAPASVQQGQSFTTQVTVCNQGTQSASTGLEVYLSADASIHANTSSAPSEDFLVGNAPTPTLNPNQCTTLSISGSAYPPPGGSGVDSAWYVGAVVDPRNSQPELREDNNATAGNRMGVGSLPDFVITSVTAPVSVQQGQSFTTQVTVCNQGTQSASTGLEVYLSADASIHANTSSGPSEDSLVGSASTPTLNPNQCATLSVSGSAYPPAPVGPATDSAWYVGAVVDPRNSQPELREDNNATAGNRMGVGSLPDFVITSVTAPASVQPGQSLTAQVTVCNQGTQSASTSLEVYLSADTSIHANTPSAPSEDYFLGGTSTPTLNPNQCTTLSVSGSAYPPPSSGGPAPDSAWYVGAVVDPRNGQPELREDNNATAGSRVGVGYLPDFVITSVTGPASVQSGQSLTAQVTVCNQGTQAASTSLEVYLSADASIHANTSSAPSEDSFVGGTSTPTLNPNQCTTLSVSGSAYPPAPSSGPVADSAWYVGAVVDPRNTQPELREDNNATAGNRVGVGNAPDFIVTSVTGPSSTQWGQSLTTQVTVCNQGTVSASSRVEAYLSADASIHANTPAAPSEDSLLGSATTPTLGSGQCVTLSLSGSVSPPPGSSSAEGAYYLGAVVDPQGSVSELREDNNATAGSRIGVGTKADFVITSVSGPSSVRQGSSFSATFTVCNRGQSSDSTDVELYFSSDTSIHANTSAGPSEDFYLGRVSGLLLAPGVCGTQTLTVSANAPSGGYYLGAVADPQNARPELIEDNNATAGTFTSVTP